LLTAATLAALGHDVVGIDEDEEKIGLLRQGVSPFFEPGLPESGLPTEGGRHEAIERPHVPARHVGAGRRRRDRRASRL